MATQSSRYFSLFFVASLCFFAMQARCSTSAEPYEKNSNIAAENLLPHFEHIPFDDIKSGSLFYQNEAGYQAQLAQNTEFNISVNGLVTRVDVTQHFLNSSPDWLEAVYVFPLPENSAVDKMTMLIGERKVVGKIKEKKQAQKIYQQAKTQGKKASIVSQQRPNMFTTKVANIAPGEKMSIHISYLQQVHFQDGQFSLRLPLTITPRFLAKQIPMALPTAQKLPEQQTIEIPDISIDDSANLGWAVIDAAEISPPQKYYPFIHQLGQQLDHQLAQEQRQGSAQQTATISASIDLGLPIESLASLYHPIVQSQHKQTLTLGLKQERIGLDQDFVLTWQVKANQQPQAAFFKTAQTDADYGLLMLVPPKGEFLKALAKEVVVIVDTSGSMSGVSIKQAKKALAYALSKLSQQDRFNIIEFNDSSQRMFVKSQLASKENIRFAQQWLSMLSAGGGTNMYPAIESALTTTEQASYYRQVIFITDGAVGDEASLFSLIENKLGSTRLHTVGIGSAPNSYFMSQSAALGRGSYRYIGDVNEVQQQINRLFDDISQPVLTDVSIKFQANSTKGNIAKGNAVSDTASAIEYYPDHIPDLYASQPLMVSAKMPKNIGEYLLVQGKLNQQRWQQKVRISQAKQQNGIASLWARAKISALSHALRREKMQARGSDNNQTTVDGIIAHITELALAHQLVSAYTSFVAVEEKVSRESKQTLHKQKQKQKIANAMPKGSQQIMVANTALGLESYISLGLILLVCALFIHVCSYWFSFGKVNVESEQ
ncbi:marine proteobacterial sortase target protein [Thalassotalea sp. PLHSN55]|uniref:marine proteobacterial sortase target protein n=1 Tax=Thalassotalea sp. PLHSN55 TaxID=3435888 RepID=UPI003F86C8CB